MYLFRTFNRFILISLALLGLSVSSANAVLIDFEEIDNTAGNVFSGSSLNSKGFNFTNSNGAGGAILHWQQSSSSNADPDGVAYSHNYSGSVTTITDIGGDAFDLTSIDFANIFDNSPYAQTFRVTGFYEAGGSVISDVVTDSLSGLETFLFNWSLLSSVTLTELSGSFVQLDNVVVNSSVNPVPVPAAVWLFGTALIGLIGFGKRKSKIAA